MPKSSRKNPVDLNALVMGLKTILIPIHDRKTQHWLLLEMNVKNKKWVFHDSYSKCLGDKGRMKIYQVLV
jgi:hypothetical protein